MKPYIQKQPKQIKERVEAKLDERLVARLEKYCRYLDSDRDYVISQALDIAFRKDQGFLEWLASQEAAPTGTPVNAAMQLAKPGRKMGRAGASGDNATGILPETGDPALTTGRP
jgi:predicted transcriptional regulator